MTLLCAVVAACISTIAWYTSARARAMKAGILCWIYWGASLMWLVDAVFEYVHLGAAYFRPNPAQMFNDLFLGLSAVTLGLVIWLAILLIRDPDGVVRQHLHTER